MEEFYEALGCNPDRFSTATIRERDNLLLCATVCLCQHVQALEAAAP